MRSLEQERKILLKRIESMGIENRELARQNEKMKKDRERLRKMVERMRNVIV